MCVSVRVCVSVSVCVRVFVGGGSMRQVPLCCKTTAKDKQKQHITVYMMQEEQGRDLCVDILLLPLFQDK